MSYGQSKSSAIEYGFTEQNEQMLKARTLLDVAFYPHLAYQGRWVFASGDSKGSIHIQRDAYIDTIVQITAQGHTLTIDEKIDSKNRSTIFAEILSVKEHNKPGWIVPGVSQADVLLWAFTMKRPPALKVYTFWLDKLIEWFWPLRDTFRVFEIRNRENEFIWTTVGCSVPIRDIPYGCYFKDKEIVEKQLSLF